MPMFRQKTTHVEARRVTKADVQEVAEWCGGLIVESKDPVDPEKVFVGINVQTNIGPDRADEGDWIVKAARGGNFWAISAKGFNDTYEAV